MNRFIFTCGDPNGIGPEIVIKTINTVYNKKDEFIFICPKNIFDINSSIIQPKFKYQFYENDNFDASSSDHVKVIGINDGKLTQGKPTKTSGSISFESIEIAKKIVDRNSAIITAPISKHSWELASIKYDGHTDFFGNKFKINNPLMLFYSPKMIAALATIHKPILQVPKILSNKLLTDIVSAMIFSLKRDFKIINPKIAILGLNPHAGEEGRIGKEELNIIRPIVKKFSKNCSGPFVPDAFFGNKLFEKYDAVLGMYHDQVLIPFKMLNFDIGVNFTANLPIVRTSPDHGTAYDIAYKGKANATSMIEAFRLAKRVLKNRNLQ
ncbi:MAG: 4-hydroxythreonine-4-phosphate dehydrogenase PdxA [Ignavibacteriales bacterium]|jgi:4-hydroxythreonine-4-phosphate dehydrogenase|nr:MAG: 4-hydroxythreonine-4-phosphate dehydrogenase PdxA [Ignavibacteriales bacterium]